MTIHRLNFTREELASLLKLQSISKIARAERVNYGTIFNIAVKYGLITCKKRASTKSTTDKHVQPSNDKENDFNLISNFETLINFWNKNKIGNKYKNEITKNIALNKLKKMANNDFDIAKKIVEQSLINCWQGLFELKKSFKDEKYTNNVISPPCSIEPEEAIFSSDDEKI
jgi:hypothetical protein